MESYITKKTQISPKDFDNVANLFLNQTVIICGKSTFKPTEIEFYYNVKIEKDEKVDRECLDCFVHCNEDQLEYGKWYFHKMGKKSSSKYKGGTYKGLDLTLGSKEKNIYCGILIRSVMDIDTLGMTEGPCRCVNLFLQSAECKSINDLTHQGFILDVLQNESKFVIKDATPKLLEKISASKMYKDTRIGLSKNNANKPEFNFKHRYLTHSEKFKYHKRSDNSTEVKL